MTTGRTQGPPVAARRPALDALVAWLTVLATPVVFVLAFLLGTALIGDPNVPGAPRGWDAAWRVLVLWCAVVTVPAVGVVFGVRAARRREPGGRAALVATVLVVLFFTVVTLGAGLLEAVGG